MITPVKVLNPSMAMRTAKFAPKTNPIKKNPFILDETLPKVEDPQKAMMEKIYKQILDKAKSKPIKERSIIDHAIVAIDYLKHLDFAKYAA